MARPMRSGWGVSVFVVWSALAIGACSDLSPWSAAQSLAQVPALPAPEAPKSEPAAPAGHAVGLTKCAACHFNYYQNWKSSPHGKAFEILPSKYRADRSCLECHLPGHDVANAAVPANQVGVSCEACHGPGSEHANLALSYVGQEKLLSEEALKTLRSTIQRKSLEQCIKCHTAMAHKPHPPYEREPAALPLPSPNQAHGKRFFDDVHP